MTGTDSTQTATRACLRCGRHASGAYGSGCSAKIRSAFRTADLSAWTPRQAADAAELIWDGGVVPTARPGVFRTVSHDGERVYLTSANGCTCHAGQAGNACLHRCAVTVILATYAKAAPAPVPAEVPVPVITAPAPAADNFIAEMERLTEAFFMANA